MKILRYFLVIIAGLAIPRAHAQNHLLHLLPDDFGIAIVMNDLRGHAARWEKSAWFKQFHQSALGKAILEAPELKQVEHWQGEVKKHLDLDWPTLRDDILGDTLVLSYSPGPKNQPDDERGLILLHLRSPDRLQRLIDKLNDAQKASGELKSLTEHKHKGITYWQRTEAKKTQFYCIKDSLAVLSPKEDLLKSALERSMAAPQESPWVKRFEKAGVDKAFVAMCVNPRMLEPDLGQDAFPRYWRALDAIFITLTVRDAAELRIAIQAKADELPNWAKPAFGGNLTTSSLWHRFPQNSVFTIASVTDFAGTVEALRLMMPQKDRDKVAKDWVPIHGFLGLDPFKDLLPNIGPDWGVCMLPAKDANHVPPMMFAIAVKPGKGKKPVDKELFKTVDEFAKLAAFNSRDQIRLQSVRQGEVEVKYLKSDKLFPPGFQPAAALKDGFLLLATSPDAIAEFRMTAPPLEPAHEATLMRISAPGLANLLEQRREHIVKSLTDKQQITKAQATRNLENVISLLGLFENVTLSQHGAHGQASWILRATPR